MSLEYIIVQAGGLGTRMDYLTANKPKALVPIANLPILFHLFKKYPDKKFIIIADYKIQVLKKYLEAFAKVKYLVVSASGKKGTCAGIKESLSLIPDNKNFMLIWSDLILPEFFELPNNSGNYVGLSKDFKCRWKFENNEFIENPSDEFGVAGFFLFENKEFINEVPVEGELVRWLQQTGKKFNTIDLYKTKEYGLIEEYDKISKATCRPFNELTFKENSIIKRGIDEQGEQLISIEKDWYKTVVEKKYDAIPQIYSYTPFELERINGKNVFEYNFSLHKKKEILKKIVDSIKKLHSLDYSETDYFSIMEAYYKKTMNRLIKVRGLIPLVTDKIIMINGKKCRNVFYYQDEFYNAVYNYKIPQFKFLHGDCTFSNIMLRGGSDPIFIDPRGYFGFTRIYGDENYDYAKLYYSIIGNYDQFNRKNFRLFIEDDKITLNIKSNGFEDLDDYFFELIGKEREKDIKFLHAIIWLSLTTYAWEDYDSICGAFYNGLYYLEDVL